MISVIMDGRNDSHGYNMHKRAAISMNCIASVLSDPDDEIVFVDYCTDTGFPTFPEAIHDLLTDAAKQRLRILRVPTQIHRQLAAPGSSAILDVIARNIGIRRSNPSNRWVLSTTSDVVIVPRAPDRSLSAICEDLPDGFYALSRFEMPQSLWESVNRRDPDSIRVQFAHWGRAFDLNETILGDSLAVFDSCGDFQLALRADLFAIHGFDERMIAGWQHSDANLQRRLALYRGGITDFTPYAFAYHCEHQRQATPTHSVDRIENDWDLFVAGLSRPELPFQAATWGFAEVDIPELRLTEAQVRAFSEALDTSAQSTSETGTSVIKRDDLSYDRAVLSPISVLPFLADHVFPFGLDSKICYVGKNIGLLRMLSGFRTKLGATEPLVALSEPLEHTEMRGAIVDLPGVKRLYAKDAPRDAALLIFDFSLDPALAAPDARIASLPPAEGLQSVQTSFLHEVAVERARLEADGDAVPRKFLIVNAIHTTVEALVDSQISATRTTFGTRIRHGFVPPPAVKRPTVQEIKSLLEATLGHRISAADLSLAFSVIASCRRGQPVDESPQWVSSPVLGAILNNAGLCAATRINPETAASLWRHLSSREDGIDLTFAQKDMPQGGDSLAVSKICDFADWDDPEWSRAAAMCTGQDLQPYHRRHRSEWERIQMVHCFKVLGRHEPADPVAMISVAPDSLLTTLTEVSDRVDVFSVDRSEIDTPTWMTGVKGARRDSVALDVGGLQQGEPTPRYGAIFVPQGSAFRHGERTLEKIVRFAEQTLLPGGLLLFACDFVLYANGGVRHWGLIRGEAFTAFDRALQQCSSLRLVGPLRLTTSPETLCKQATIEESQRGKPHALLIDSDHIRTSSVWICRNTEQPEVRRDKSLATELMLGRNLLQSMSHSDLSRWAAGRVHINDEAGEGCVLYGPYVPLAAGTYRLTLDAELAPQAGSEGRLTLDVACNTVSRMRRDWSYSELAGETLALEFSSEGSPDDVFEFRVFTTGALAGVLVGLYLSRI